MFGLFGEKLPRDLEIHSFSIITHDFHGAWDQEVPELSDDVDVYEVWACEI